MNLNIAPAIIKHSKSLMNALESNDNKLIDDTLHKLIMSILNIQYTPKGNFTCPLYMFIVYSSVSPSGQILDPGGVNGILSELKWPLHASTFWEIVIQQSDTEHPERWVSKFYFSCSNLPCAFIFLSVVEDVRKAVREDGFRPFSHIMEMTHFLTILDANTPRMPRMIWNDDVGETMIFDGHPITTTSFWIMYQKLLQDTRELLLNKVLLNLELPNLWYEHIYDELNNRQAGYSFINDTCNKYHNYHTFLISSMLDARKHGDHFYYHKHTNDRSGIAWNNASVIEWLKICETCISNLFALIHYSDERH